MKNDYINRKVEETLSSVDNIQRAEPAPFLFTRVLARLQATKEGLWERTSRFISRPAYAIAGLSLVIILNLAVAGFLTHAKENSNKQSYVTDYLSSNDLVTDDIQTTNP
jgi:hypothetical protein